MIVKGRSMGARPTTVAKGSVMGMSPMYLPELCVKCGRDAADGKHIHTKKDHYWRPRSPVFRVLYWCVFVLMLPWSVCGPKETLEVNYSLCKKCVRARWRKRMLATGLWLLLLFVLPLLLNLAFGGTVAGVVFLAWFCLGWLYPWLAGSTGIRVSAYMDEVFTVEGMSETFLTAMRNWKRMAQRNEEEVSANDVV